MKRIQIKGLHKTLSKIKKDVFLELLLGKRTPKSFHFQIEELTVNSREIVGITGSNGSGKSTLLRLIAKIYVPDSGKIITKGKILPLLNLKMGLQWNLSLLDNISYVGTLFGMEKEDIQKNQKKIVAFAGLQGSENKRIYQFSEGMKQRMIFSIMIHANADILLLDEVFEVGDEEFKKKSYDALLNFQKKGGSVLLVSHDKSILEICDKVITI